MLGNLRGHVNLRLKYNELYLFCMSLVATQLQLTQPSNIRAETVSHAPNEEFTTEATESTEIERRKTARQRTRNRGFYPCQMECSSLWSLCPLLVILSFATLEVGVSELDRGEMPALSRGEGW